MNPTTPKSEHSPLPWKWEIVSENPDLSEITDADGEYIADVFTERCDGHFIVEACNNHETLKAQNEMLVRALGEAVNALELGHCYVETEAVDEAVCAYTEAIKEAKAVVAEVGK